MSKLRFESARAKIGATLLDVIKPGWATEINKATLKLDDCNVCILGQLFGSYGKGAEQVFAMAVTNPSTPDHDFFVSCNPAVNGACERAGFVMPECDEDGRYMPLTPAYRKLTAAWKREVDRRVNASK